MTTPPEPGTPVPALPVLEYVQPGAIEPARAPVPGVVRVLGAVAGIVVPLVCFVTSFFGIPLGPEWQSGEFYDYVRLLLWPRGGWPFYPLLIYCMTCLGYTCVAPRRAGQRSWVRLGLYTGIWLSLQYCVVIVLSLHPVMDEDDGLVRMVMGLGIFGGSPVGVAAVLMVLFARFRARWVWLGIGTLLIAAGLAAQVLAPGLLEELPQGALFVTLIFGPLWCLEGYAAVTVYVRRRVVARDRRGARVLAPVWLGAYSAAWGLAVWRAIATYRTLPTSRPTHCYVASAAARGHGWFVGARVVGGGVAVNEQLRRLKCAEIALAAVWPAGHRALRRAYDRLGPALAARMGHPLVADLAYAMLKPAEWGAVWVLRRLVPDFDRVAAGVYSDDPDGSSLFTIAVVGAKPAVLSRGEFGGGRGDGGGDGGAGGGADGGGQRSREPARAGGAAAGVCRSRDDRAAVRAGIAGEAGGGGAGVRGAV